MEASTDGHHRYRPAQGWRCLGDGTTTPTNGCRWIRKRWPAIRSPISVAARRLGFQQLQQGLQEIGQGQARSGTVQKSGHGVLKLQTEAAQNAAPWTTTIGMGAPEVLAGGAAAMGTGGMSIPAMLLGQAGAGGLVGFMKPGDVSERVKSAAVGAVFAAGGAGLGEAAMRGISSGTDAW